MYKTAFVPFTDVLFEYKENVKHVMTYCHYHDTYEIYLQMNMQRKVVLNGYSYILHPGDLCFIRPFDLHRCENLNGQNSSHYVLNFSDANLALLLSEAEQNSLINKLPTGICHLTPQQYQWILHIFQSLSSALEHPGFLTPKLISSHLLTVLSALKDCPIQSEKPLLSVEAGEVRPELMIALEYINKNYQNDISLEQVAKQVHISKYHFSRMFSSTLGFGFLEYLNKVRLSKAHQLLVDSDFSINDIASQTGFHSATHFSRVFMNAHGSTPSDFRKKHSTPDKT